jgi:glycosyltransferase involved in cell wall biosynthesis
MSESQRRILHVVGTMDPGGYETWLLHVLEHIDRDRFQFDFCACGTKPGLYDSKIERLGGRIITCPKGTNLLSFRRRFRGVLSEGEYDVVHSHVHFFSGVLLCWARAEHIPLRIAHSHTTQDGQRNDPPRHFYRRTMRSWINHHATHGLAASKPAARELFGKNWQADERFQTLDYGVDLRPFQELVRREEVRAELGIPKDALVVGHVGRFDVAKNHRFLLEVAGAVLKSRQDVHFLLVGDGLLRPEIEARVRHMGLSRTIHFVGIRTDVPRLMLAAMDLFVFPSLYEGLGICLLEAQMAGLRCLVSDMVPKEVARLRESVEFLSLSTGKEHWASRIIQGLDARQTGQPTVLGVEAQNKFSMQRSLQRLMGLYSVAQDSIPHVTLERHV